MLKNIKDDIKVLFVGDPHFQVNNIPEVEQFIEKMIELAKEKKPDFILIAGDLLHTHERLHTTPLNKAYDFVNSMRQISKTIVLVGNHDMENNQKYLTSEHWMNGMKEWENVTIVDKVIGQNYEDNFFIFMPYVYPGRFQEALNTYPGWEKADCIFAHQEFFGCKMGAIISIEGDKWPLEFPNVISGHIHSKQRPQKNIYYSGSSMQHAFGESKHKIIAYLEFGEDKEYGTYDLQEIDLKLPGKKIVYLDIEKLEDYKIEEETRDKIKITVSGVYEQFKSFKKTNKYKKMINQGIKVVFKTKKIEQIELDDNNEKNKKTDFTDVLYSLVGEQKNKHILEAYKLVVNS